MPEALLNPDSIPSRTPEQSILATLLDHYSPEEAEAIHFLIRPHLADEAMHLATVLLAKVFDALRGSPQGEALLHLLGLPYSNGTLRQTAQQMGCSHQAIVNHTAKLRPFLGQLAPPSFSGHKPSPEGHLDRPQACKALSCSSRYLHLLERASLLAPKTFPAHHQTFYLEHQILALQRLKATGGKNGSPLSWSALMRAKTKGNPKHRL